MFADIFKIKNFVIATLLFGAVIVFLLLTKVTIVGRFNFKTKPKPSLLLVSFDGFRWDYLTRTATPNFDRFVKNGVTVRWGLKNVFPTNTLPNHWSLVTGLYPESHGVLDNYLMDSNIKKQFIPKYMKNRYQNDPRYYDDGGEPIWVTNQLHKQGRSGSVMWYGSENPVKRVRPTFQMPFNKKVSFSDRIDTVVSWFASENPINLGLLYFPEPDKTAHRTGPDSVDVTEQISNADRLVGYLLEKLEEKDLLDDLNIIITSDHGFANISRERLIHLDRIVSTKHFKNITKSPVVSILPNDGMFDDIFSKLKSAATQPGSHFQVYKADEIPERFHYKHHRRVLPITVVAELGYSLTTLANDEDFIKRGNHGFDNNYQEMHPFFVAMGPSFKQGFAVDTLNTVDIYPLMCHLLDLKPAPNNGSMKIPLQLLHDNKNTVWSVSSYILILIAVASVFSAVACHQHGYLKRKLIQLKLATGRDVKTSPISAQKKDKDKFDDRDNILVIVSRT